MHILLLALLFKTLPTLAETAATGFEVAVPAV
jgi:hypothetical protein